VVYDRYETAKIRCLILRAILLGALLYFSAIYRYRLATKYNNFRTSKTAKNSRTVRSGRETSEWQIGVGLSVGKITSIVRCHVASTSDYGTFSRFQEALAIREWWELNETCLRNINYRELKSTCQIVKLLPLCGVPNGSFCCGPFSGFQIVRKSRKWYELKEKYLHNTPRSAY
jgi:hypothetical protein